MVSNVEQHNGVVLAQSDTCKPNEIQVHPEGVYYGKDVDVQTLKKNLKRIMRSIGNNMATTGESKGNLSVELEENL